MACIFCDPAAQNTKQREDDRAAAQTLAAISRRTFNYSGPESLINREPTCPKVLTTYYHKPAARLAVLKRVSAALDLRPGVAFFALARNGQITLHRNTDRHFLDPREQGSVTLEKAAIEMLAGTSGMTAYEFDSVTKNAKYR